MSGELMRIGKLYKLGVSQRSGEEKGGGRKWEANVCSM